MITAVVVGGVVILGGTVIAFAAGSKPAVGGPQYIPPPPPPPPLTPGGLLVTAGGQLLDQLGHNDVVTTYTGGEKAAPYIIKNIATGGLYGTAKGAVNVGKKIISSIF